ncbi:MAG: S8 family serine peptidase, partial [Anaerolineales bacterium]|nr:S8 family serine peptidase [Anaerolineales bacterium]
MNTWSKKSLSLMLGVVLIAAFFNPVIVPEVTSKSILSPRWLPPKPAHTAILEGQSLEAIHIKFIEGSSFRLRHGEMITLGNDDLAGIQAVLNAYPVRSIERLFSQAEDELSAKKLELEAVSGEQMPDLNLWYRFTVEAGVDPTALIDALNGLPVVETAYPAPLPVPPASYKSASTALDTVQFVDAVTPNYVSQQGYLNPAPGGIEAKYAWTLPGGKGQNVTIVDVEYDFNKNHEDLVWKSIPVIAGQLYSYEDHGTAVLGELVSQSNTFGVTGIAHLAKAAVAAPCSNSSNCGSYNPANAINIARTHTVKGDIILIEQQTPVCGLSDYGPLEWSQAVYDAIKTSTTDGRIVVEAAGNGGVNLDRTSCQNKFNRSTRDSGAILVGAGATPTSSQADR